MMMFYRASKNSSENIMYIYIYIYIYIYTNENAYISRLFARATCFKQARPAC